MSINPDTMPKLGFGLMRLPEKDGKIELKEKRPPVWKVAVVSGALQKKRVRRSVADEILDRFMSETLLG